jgi:hypothetical protein
VREGGFTQKVLSLKIKIVVLRRENYFKTLEEDLKKG